jgi:hypothetical protein
MSEVIKVSASNNKKLNSGRGGKRAGAGQPKKEETAVINFRIKKSEIKHLKEKYGKTLNQMFKEWVKAL